MKTKHTKGNWEQSNENKLKISSNNILICLCSRQRKTEKEAKANAKLLASAPKLLEKCQTALLVFEAIEEDGNINCPELGIIKSLKEVIKQATD